MSDTALLYSGGLLDSSFAKTAHGLLRAGTRFDVVGVVDEKHAGADVRSLVPGAGVQAPVFASVQAALHRLEQRPACIVVGTAFSGGQLPPEHRAELLSAVRAGLTLVCGLHQQLGDDAEFRTAAQAGGAQIVDVRKPGKLHFWTGEILSVLVPRLAVLGTDCAIGKRTTAQLIVHGLQGVGLHGELIYTGQTGWMQGAGYGFVLDATPNDFVGGQLEAAMLACACEARPDLMVIEGQASLRHPAGACGGELLASGDVRGVVLQHIPGRAAFEDFEHLPLRVPPAEAECELIGQLGAQVIAVCLNESQLPPAARADYKQELASYLSVPVLNPLHDPIAPLIDAVSAFVDRDRQRLSGQAS